MDDDLWKDFSITYTIASDGQLIASINGQAHLPVDVLATIHRLQARIKELGAEWRPVPNQFEYEGKRRGNPRWLVVHTIDNSGESYLVLESPEDGEKITIELPSWLSLCRKVVP